MIKDLKFPILIAVPAAVTILGIVWFLRKKSGKGEKRKKTEDGKLAPIGELSNADGANRNHYKPSGEEKEGITLTQRKIPEANSSGKSSKPSYSKPFSSDESKPLTDFEKEKVQEIVNAAIGAGLQEAKVKAELQETQKQEEVHEEMMIQSITSVPQAVNNSNSMVLEDYSNSGKFHEISICSNKSDSCGVGPLDNAGIEELLDQLVDSKDTSFTLDSKAISTSSTYNLSSNKDNTIAQEAFLSQSLPDENQVSCSSSLPLASNNNKDNVSDENSISESIPSMNNISSQNSTIQKSESKQLSSELDKKEKAEESATSTSPGCDNNSVGSSEDSGRGGSEQDSVVQNHDGVIHFDFNMPSELCGRLIGRQGKNINHIKSKSGAMVSLTNNPLTSEFQICQVVGTQAEVDEALSLIRKKFPLGDFPHLTMTPINLTMSKQVEPAAVLVPDNMQMNLPDGASVEVYVSTIVDAGHVFLQQPTHRSFMSLEKLNFFLNSVYSQDDSIPSLPTPIECGVICVCENEGSWYRAMVMTPEDEYGQCQVKFVDYGGYTQLPISCIKQIRADFMNLPFQAVECFVANIAPLLGEEYFSTESTMALSEMSQLKLLQCQVVARNEMGTPYVHLYLLNPETNTATLVNKALVNQGLVRWVDIV